MSPVTHTALSGIVSVGFVYITNSWAATLVCFLSGIFIDLDHVIDFVLYKKKIPRGYCELLSFCCKEKGGKLYLLFHSYEFLLVLWVMIFYFNLNVLWFGCAVGVTFHIFADQVFNPLKPFVYFFVYRLQNGFVRECVYPKRIYDKLK